MYSKWTTSEEHAEGKTKFLGGARNITSVDGQVTVILLGQYAVMLMPNRNLLIGEL